MIARLASTHLSPALQESLTALPVDLGGIHW
jgi:hypothetical protein